jgi:hypothetical protein
MILAPVQAFQRQPVQPTNFVEEKLEPIYSALKTFAHQCDVKGTPPELRGRAGHPENTSYIEKCEKCAPKMFSERI